MSYQQQPPMYPPPPPPPPPMQSPPGKGLCVASMVLGICALVIPYGGLALAIVGLILGIIGRKKMIEVGAPTGMATAGIVMSIIAIAWSIIFIIICVSCVASIGNAANWSYNLY